MNRYLELGTVNRLTIARMTDYGPVLASTERKEVLLPKRYATADMQVGDRMTGYVKFVRPDGKIDLLSRPIGKAKERLAADEVLDYLRSHRGMMPLNYKSDPEAIGRLLGLSKKAFKQSLSSLREKGWIEVKEQGTFLKRGKHK